MALTAMGQICADLSDHIKKTTQKYLKRNVRIEEMPQDDIDVLLSYLPVSFVCGMFGGETYAVSAASNARRKEKAIEEANRKIMEEATAEGRYEPEEPAGIANWQYAERIKQKVFRSLETVLNQGAGTAGHNQYVQAAKALLDQAEKVKGDAAEVMKAYEVQLLVLADFLVERFLPKLGTSIKTELEKSKDDILTKLEKNARIKEFERSLWVDEINKLVRAYNLKRFELMLAECMAGDSNVCAAFDFSKDLVENYKGGEKIRVDDKHKEILKQHINARG